MKVETEKSKGMYVICTGGQLCGPSIQGPFSHKILKAMWEIAENSSTMPPGTITCEITRIEATRLLLTDKFENYSDILIDKKSK